LKLNGVEMAISRFFLKMRDINPILKVLKKPLRFFGTLFKSPNSMVCHYYMHLRHAFPNYVSCLVPPLIQDKIACAIPWLYSAVALRMQVMAI